MTTNSKEYARKYYQEHKEALKESHKRYQEKKRIEKMLKQTNPRLFDMREDFSTPTRQDFQAIPQQELTYSQRYYAANRDRIRAKQNESRRRQKINAKQREYYAKNREHICEMQRKNRAAKKRQGKLSKTFLGRLYLKIFG